MMNTNKRKILTVSGAVLILITTFALGYWTGAKSPQGQIETTNGLSNKDMEHAFGNIKSSAHESATAGQEPQAMSLGGLVAGLEKKVAANPDNIDQQLLLAQTYKELDNRDKALALLQGLNKRVPKNAQVKLTLASILMNSEDKQGLMQASRLLDEASALNPELASMARLYQGEIKVKLNNNTK